MKKSELRKIIKNELLKEGFEGFNGVIGLGSTNKMTSLTEMDDMYGNERDFGDAKTESNDQDIAEILQDALDKIEDAGVSIADEGRSIQDIFNKLIIGLSRESDRKVNEVMIAGEFVKPEIVTAIMAIVPTLVAIGAAINWKEELRAWAKQMKAKYAK